jgi:hypothetical protein
MQQQAILQKGVSKHAPHSSTSTRPPSRHMACQAAQGHLHSQSSTASRLAHNWDVSTADWHTLAASSGSTFPVVRGQQWLQAAALALLQLHLVSGNAWMVLLYHIMLSSAHPRQQACASSRDIRCILTTTSHMPGVQDSNDDQTGCLTSHPGHSTAAFAALLDANLITGTILSSNLLVA